MNSAGSSVRHPNPPTPARPSHLAKFPQFSLRMLFLITAGAAIVFAVIRWTGTFAPFVLMFAVSGSCWLAGAYYVSHFVRTAWSLAAITAVFAVVLAIDTYQVITILVMLGALWFWPVAVLASLECKPATPARRPLRPMLIVVASLACLASLPLTQWSLRLAFAYSRPSLEELAGDLQAGQVFPTPQRAGLFVIRKYDVKPDGRICSLDSPRPRRQHRFRPLPARTAPLAQCRDRSAIVQPLAPHQRRLSSSPPTPRRTNPLDTPAAV
jgi:hypothetical protein